jgi:hypothetical protein
VDDQIPHDAKTDREIDATTFDMTFETTVELARPGGVGLGVLAAQKCCRVRPGF